MQLDKKKYKKIEVETLLTEERTEKETEISKLKEEIENLTQDNAELQNKIAEYKTKEEEINKALISAEKKAKEIEETTSKKYETEVERLKLFWYKWQSYFDYLFETYPNYQITEKVKKIKSLLIPVFEGTRNSREVIDDLNNEIKDEVAVTNATPTFNPKAKIEKYIQGDSGFDMNAVLYPDQKDLNLEELCKELGLMEDK